MNFTYPDLKRLYESSLETFSGLPQVSRIAIYGSGAKKSFDRYSDLDLEVQLSEWNTLSTKIESSLKKIDSPFIVFPAVNDPGNGVLTVLWRNFPFYQKLDMRLTSSDTPLSEGSEIVYEKKKNGKSDEKTKKLLKLSFEENYRPFYDMFIGATRFAKHRRRGEYLSAYKFYRSGWESLAKLYLFDLKEGKYTNNIISIENLKVLDREDKSIANILAKYISSNPQNIDEYYVNLLERYMNESKLSGLVKKSSLEEDFGLNVIQFVRNELFGK
ncbi:MAG: hypothetical protein HY044_04345 [Candidatus Woesebacteria bacterium]|nr:MAG: hypothetical protein HY044_04345 [Candidatus Woesebacteria bacterium]